MVCWRVDPRRFARVRAGLLPSRRGFPFLSRRVCAAPGGRRSTPRRAGNMLDEKGDGHPGKDSISHDELWLDFAEGMGSSRNLDGHKPLPEVQQLMQHFQRAASEGTPEEALAAFYAYESQVPRVAQEKERGLRKMYGADEKTRGYFALHATADV